ncbi:MAG: hypothetical protein K1X44_04250 [Alphaproteobacteria bacterium]|nr:hypothetical protein [Alphaproteobacteria bacterium]
MEQITRFRSLLCFVASMGLLVGSYSATYGGPGPGPEPEEPEAPITEPVSRDQHDRPTREERSSVAYDQEENNLPKGSNYYYFRTPDEIQLVVNGANYLTRNNDGTQDRFNQGLVALEISNKMLKEFAAEEAAGNVAAPEQIAARTKLIKARDQLFNTLRENQE